ncbi:lamin tail domain-containing protein [Streptomyces sp. NA02950]|uniref:lamin tail domain-containing protein n=1 Tax=Streptomyces sp. NA02950 TaxID=2742137 RepID=UPI0015920F2F|nr:lamin tail domain-containing protein [Streptomyces sp. NA02950]QKV90892.1 lamin tail domain-containing protein [Streptomyces sp. NA02950]
MTRLTRLAAGSLAATALLGAAALPADAHPGTYHSRVVIGEVQYNSPGSDDYSRRSLRAEWVTITNTGRQRVDLDGWTLADTAGHVYLFEDLTLRGYESVRVRTGSGDDTERDVYQNSRTYIWNNDGDTAILRNDHNRVVDAKSWGRQGHWHHRR